MPRADFTDADLSGSDMTKSELSRTIFTDSVLTGVDMSGALLVRTNLTDADLEGVNFTDAIFLLTHIEGADLSRAIGLTQEQLAEACGDEDTKLPKGLEAPSPWSCGSD